MDALIEFAKGPLFRLTFAIMLLGLLRLIVLSIINGIEAKGKAQDKVIPKSYVRKLTWGFLIPIRSFRVKPLYSIVSILFHIGLLITPILLYDHNLLFNNSIGFSLIGISIPKEIADFLTILTIITGLLLLIMRASSSTARFLSRKQEYLWLLLLVIPFFTGMIISQTSVSPDTYKFFFLLHLLSGCLIFVLMPFTKIAHCVLMPIGQWITARSWKFTQEGGEFVTISLGKEGEKV